MHFFVKTAVIRLAKIFTKSLSFYLLIAVLPLSFGFTQEAKRISTAEAAKLGVGQNIVFVERLIHESVASKQILESDNQEARNLRDKAIQHLEEAKVAKARGDDKAVAEALHEAKTAIFTGMRLVGKKVVEDKRKEIYQNKRSSLIALLEALQRIANEKTLGEESKEIEEFAHIKLDEAEAQYSDGHFTESIMLIDSGYMSVKLALTKLREGETLVRSLNFETLEDEYRYELDRNDTHKMLVNTVLKEKRADPRLGKLMDIPMNQADKLRNQAEAEANNGNYESAIKIMEQSTKQIIKAIRMGGIFIPG